MLEDVFGEEVLVVRDTEDMPGASFCSEVTQVLKRECQSSSDDGLPLCLSVFFCCVYVP